MNKTHTAATSELLAKDSGAAGFWALATSPALSSASSAEEQYGSIIAEAGKHISGLSLDLFKAGLAARTASPAVEMQLKLARDWVEKAGVADCAAFVVVAGEHTCDPANLQTLLAAAEGAESAEGAEYSVEVQLDVDHAYPTTSGTPLLSNAPTAYVYADIGTSIFAAFHAALTTEAEAGKVVYVLRHHLAEASTAPLRLSGYGVELDVKKLAYIAVDDKKIDDTGSDTAAADKDKEEEEEEDEDVEGFMINKLKTMHPDLSDGLKRFKEHLASHGSVIKELKVWELQDVSVQATQRILRDESPLQKLQDLSHFYPVRAHGLLKETVDEAVVEEITYNQEQVLAQIGLEGGASLLTINSLVLETSTADVFSLLSVLKSESKTMDKLAAIGLPTSLVKSLAAMPGDKASASSEGAVDLRDPAVFYYNDLEDRADPRYQQWPSSLMGLLRQGMPGQLKYIANNIFTSIFVLDPASDAGMDTIIELADLIDAKQYPIRVGMLFATKASAGAGVGGDEHKFKKPSSKKKKKAKKADDAVDVDAGADVVGGDDVGTMLVRSFSYFKAESSAADAWAWMVKVVSESRAVGAEPGGEEPRGLSLEDLEASVAEQAGDDGNAWKMLQTSAKYDAEREASSSAIAQLGVAAPAGKVSMYINGNVVKETDGIVNAIGAFMMDNLMPVQRALYYGELAESGNVLDYLMSQPGVVKRVCSRAAQAKQPTIESGLANGDVVANSLRYFAHPETSDAVKDVTVWVVTDLNSAAGQRLAFEALKSQLATKKSRVALVHNGAAAASGFNVAAFVSAVSSVLDVDPALNAVGKSLAQMLNVGTDDVDAILKKVKKAKRKKCKEAMESKDTAKQIDAVASFMRGAYNLVEGASAVVVNGKLLGPLADDELFVAADFDLVIEKAAGGQAGKVAKLLATAKMPSGTTTATKNNLVLKTIVALASSSGGGASQQRLDSKMLAGLKMELSTYNATSGEEEEGQDIVQHEVFAVLDPLSKDAQVLAPLLTYLTEITSVKLTVVFNPKLKVSEAPLKRFYHSVLPKLSFGEGGALEPGPSAVFKKLPTAPLLTLAMHVPSSWLVQAADSPWDLDNIRLDVAKKGVHARFSLEYILVEGSCIEAETRQPTAGLQFQLGTAHQGPMFDTIVMSNLGYFQLKAVPGVWQLRLRKGRSQDIYNISKAIGTESRSSTATPTVVLDTFDGKNVRMAVQRNPGMETAELYADPDAAAAADANEEVAPAAAAEVAEKKDASSSSSSMWSSLKSLIGTEEKEIMPINLDPLAAKDRAGETINVFSLASGHLYERFLKIMMLSVLKSTNNPVKFWFLKNCMSPQLQQFLPYMAKKYGFEYQLVQYKWPNWLNLPPTKHRQIWGYKILFLDVLFPLDVKKFIFVDADQVVRGDLKELVELDLEGAPYGYTPMGSDREEMEG